LLPVRVIGSNSLLRAEMMAEGLHYAKEQGAKILSVSLGGPFPLNQWWDAIDEAARSDCLIVAAAANDGEDPLMSFVHFPAAWEPCLAVGALRPDNTRWPYSCFGPPLDLCAPSGDGQTVGIWTTDSSGQLGYNQGGAGAEEASGDYLPWFNGTSAATPVVSGVAALVWSTYPSLTAQQVRQILEETATKVDPDRGQWRNGHSWYYGFGKVNALAALERARAIVQAR
jgi:subtilisin family serine protease